MVRRLEAYGPTRFRLPIERKEFVEEIAIGAVVPFDFQLDWEYWKYLPQGVSLYFTRTPYVRKPVGITLAKEIGKTSTIMAATRALSSLDPAVTLYACSSGSFIRGIAGEELQRKAMLDAGARRAVTTSGAMVDALRHSGAQRIGIATPYTRSLTSALADFLEEAGFDVVSAHYLGLSSGISAVSQRTIASLVMGAASPDADAVFVSCTALETYGMVAALEREIKRPVFTSNQVSFWAALRAAGALHIKRGPDGKPWIMGGGRPMARSTRLLVDAGRTERRRGAA